MPAEPAPPRRTIKRRLKRVAALGLVVLLAFGVAGELFARYGLGLGDPPLSIADPDVEYLFAPSRTYHRFGNVISYNAYSMRSEPFPAHKADARERRVIVIGDSVVNGGAQTDQAELATTLLQAALRDELKGPVHVGNVSAGSWGPPNMFAYARKFGLFDADVVVIVLSSHDAFDAPTFAPVVGVAPEFPDRSPALALEEVFTRYLPRYLNRAPAAPTAVPTGAAPSGPAPTSTDSTKSIDSIDSIGATATASTAPPAPLSAVEATKDLIRFARDADAAVIVAQYLTPVEQRFGPEPGHDLLLRAARAVGVEPVQLGPALAKDPAAYRDTIHPGAVGQRLIYETLHPIVRDAMTNRPATR